MEMQFASSLVKCFWHEKPADFTACTHGSLLWGERFSLQLLYRADFPEEKQEFTLKVTSPLAPFLRFSRVLNVPVMYAATPGLDEDVLSRDPGLYPDLLLPIQPDTPIPLVPGQSLALWIDLELPQGSLSGDQPLQIAALNRHGEVLSEAEALLHVVPACLPEQSLKYTNWFYTDCLANYYHVPVFGEEHWRIIEAFMQKAVACGINMILTPVLTPALDTAIGAERTTTQLVDVSVSEGEWHFGTDKLERFILLAQKCGIRDFEICHFFSQWGAAYAPKVMATMDGRLQRIFGWETDAASPLYRDFLTHLIPCVLDVFRKLGLFEHVYFHLSDEPGTDTLARYADNAAFLKPLLQGRPVMDALSHYEYAQQKLTDIPIPATDAIEPFLNHHTPNLWTYYCCGARKKVSTRFIAVPSRRNRVLGLQLYKYDIKGFLHWGYNYYNNQYSRSTVEPFVTTDGDYFAEAGDAYVVYPGQGGVPLSSIRGEVFFDALQDQRACQLLEKLSDKETVLGIIDKQQPISFFEYPREDEWLLELRESINKEIEKRL